MENTRTLEFSWEPCYTHSMGLSAYIDAALASARFKKLEDKTYFGEIPGFRGVWASAKTSRRCRETLREVLEDWIVLKLRSADALPSIRGKRLTLPELTRA
jgi:predicted RNase H-like HicB family nuclease